MINSEIFRVIGYYLGIFGATFGIIALVFLPNDIIGVVMIFSSLVVGSFLAWISQIIKKRS